MNNIMHPDDAAELMGDGYSNELQRCAAWSAMQPKKDDAEMIGQLLAAGVCVAVSYHPLHCRGTDAIIGETIHLEYASVNRSRCEGALRELFEAGRMDEDSRYLVLPVLPVVSPVVETVDSAEIPF
jgi:hypothetical protein